jgi:hypothetical protein
VASFMQLDMLPDVGANLSGVSSSDQQPPPSL